MESVSQNLDVTGFTDYERAFGDRDIECAIVAVSPDSHVSVTTDCLERGVHTYLEKPARPVNDPDVVLWLGDARVTGKQTNLY